MLRTILSISGKPGIFKLISRNNSILIVESLVDGKRFPSYPRDRVVALADVAMYTETDEVPLRQVLKTMQEFEKGAVASCDPKADGAALREYFAQILPDFDRDRVHNSDIKKLIQWYNLLIESGNSDFEEKNEESAE